MTLSSKRAEQVSILGLVLSIVFFVVTFIVGIMGETFAVTMAAWQILSSVLVWFVLLVQFHQRHLAEQEKLDIAQLTRTSEAGTIFQAGSDRAALFAEAQRRLEMLEKWFVPCFGIVIALYQAGIGLFMITRVKTGLEYSSKNPSLSLVFMVLVSFLSFLISRYATGMSSQTIWKPLRAGGSILLASSILSFLVSLALGVAFFHYPVGLRILAWAIPIILTLLGIETLLNAMLDFYRPRIAGQYSRSCFDSRLLGLFNEPGGLFHTVASAIDYQFGFQVSQTWFYKLLEKAVLPLALFAIVVLYLLSCFVVVYEGHEAVIERFGSPNPEQGGRYVGPGLYVKYPWPFDKVYSHPTGKAEQIHVGFVENESGSEQKALLWGEEHYKEEFDLLVATTEQGQRAPGDPPAVNIVRAAVPIHYRVKDLKSYLYNYFQNPDAKDNTAKALLEAISYRELARFAASAKIDAEELEGSPTGHSPSLLGPGREIASNFLRSQIQAAADRAGLGVEILVVNLQGIHPPPAVTEAFQNVVSAGQKKQTEILNAKSDRNKILTELCGSTEKAAVLYDLAKQYQQAGQQGNNREQLDAIRKAFLESQGDIFQSLRQAEAYRFERETLAKAIGQRFQGQIQAYRASPNLYTRFLRLEALEETLPGIRKYVLIADPADMQIFQLDLQEELSEGIYNLQVPKEKVE